jgi:hypothetical protein
MSNFKLDPSEVISTSMTSHSQRKKARDSRANMRSGAEIILQHKPTGIEVRGSVPAGHYTRKEMQLLHQKLYDDLYAALEQAVARAMRMPGQ